MKTAKLEFLRIYTTADSIVRVYLTHCSEELKELMKKNNKYYREDESGIPLYFSSRDLSLNPKCKIDTMGRVRFVEVDLLEGFV
jgi:hypothetical protein